MVCGVGNVFAEAVWMEWWVEHDGTEQKSRDSRYGEDKKEIEPEPDEERSLSP